jgi:hypothetical protein
MASDLGDRVMLRHEDAVSMLPDGESVHTFRNAGSILVGADWDRDELITHMAMHSVEQAGPAATAMKHGMVLQDRHGWLFIATKE